MRAVYAAVVCVVFCGAANACNVVQQVVAAPVVAQAVVAPVVAYPVVQQVIAQPVVQAVVAQPVIQKVKVARVRAQKIKTKTVIR